MTGAMYAAIGGLKSHMANLNVIGNNIANVNTMGYKSQRMTFQESIYTLSKSGSNGTLSVGGNNPSQVGYGASVGSIDLNMNPSTYSPTGLDLDCMLMGEGFFLVGDKDISIGSASDLPKFDLTRVGDFWKDPEGYIADRGGAVAYGFQMLQNAFRDKGEEGVSSAIRSQYAQYLGYNNSNGLSGLLSSTQMSMVSATLGPMRMPLGAAAPTRANGGILRDGTHVWEEGDPVYDLLGPVVRGTGGVLSRNAFSLADLVAEAYANVNMDAARYPTDPDEDNGIGITYAMAVGKVNSEGEIDTDDVKTNVWVYESSAGGARVFMDANKNILKIEFNDGTGTPEGGLVNTGTEDAPVYDTVTYNWGPPTSAGAGEPDATTTGYYYDADGKLVLGEASKPANAQTPAANAACFWEYDGPIPNSEGLVVEASSMSVTAQGGVFGITDTGMTFFAGYLAVGSCASNDGVTNIGGPYYKCQEGAGDMRVAALGGLLAGRYIGGVMNINLVGGELLDYQPAGLERILSGGTNEIKNGGLEASGTDVATEFSNMIITQRGYQANTRIVTVTDSMLEELVNMKR